MLITLMGQIGLIDGSTLWIRPTNESQEKPDVKKIFHYGCLVKVLIPQKYKGNQLDQFQHLGDLIEMTVKGIDKTSSKVVIHEVIRIWSPK